MSEPIDFYTKERVDYLLYGRFHNNPIMLEIINKMTIKHRQYFAAMCDGLTLTTIGYNVDADIYRTRAPILVEKLRNSYNLPIKTDMRVCKDGSNPVGVFYIDKEDISRLETDTVNIIFECKEQNIKNSFDRDRNSIRRIHEKHGLEIFEGFEGIKIEK